MKGDFGRQRGKKEWFLFEEDVIKKQTFESNEQQTLFEGRVVVIQKGLILSYALLK